jgi:hypothetical protein
MSPDYKPWRWASPWSHVSAFELTYGAAREWEVSSEEPRTPSFSCLDYDELEERLAASVRYFFWAFTFY